MRILFFARRKKTAQTPGQLANGLRAIGHDVRMIRYGFWKQFLGGWLLDRLLLTLARAWKADLVLVWKDCLSLPLMAALGKSCMTVVYCVDWFHKPPGSICKRARLADLLLLSNSGQFDMYRSAGIEHVAYLPQGCDTEKYRPVPSAPDQFRSDVAFIGSPSRGNGRLDLLDMIDKEFNLKIWGPNWGEDGRRFRALFEQHVFPQQYARICRGARIILGCDAAQDLALCFSNRVWLTLGCGGFYLTNNVPELETLFENHRHLVWYNSPEECLELIRYYLPREEERRRIAQAGLELVRSRHTYVHRAHELMELVDQLRKEQHREKTG